jgi:LPS O-antigen subunit length determinant protein (WzzB/FepE family)
MTPPERNNYAPVRQSDDTIDLEFLAHEVWRKRWLVIACILFGGLAGLGLSVMGTGYKSRGLLLTPETTVADYKRWSEAMLNLPRLERFLQANGKQDQPVAALMRNAMRDQGQLQQALRPEFSFTDRDAKEFGVQLESVGVLVGIELMLKQKHPDSDAPVLTLAEYLRDTAIVVDLETAVWHRCFDNEAREQVLRNEQLEAEFQVAQLEARAARLREIVERHPDARSEVRQVVSVEHGGDRFLPPATQLATTEISIADRRIEATKRERDRTAADLRRTFYCGAREQLQRGMPGRDFLLSLPELLARSSADKDFSVNVIEQTINELTLQTRFWTNHYLEQLRFVVSPQGAHALERKPGRAVGLILGTILGGGIGVLLAIALGWWRQHRDGILIDEP